MSIFLGFVDATESPKTKSVDTSNLLKKDGSDSMAGNLDMGKYEIQNMKTYPSDNFSAASKKYVDDEISKTLDLDANRQMKGDLDMGDNSIVAVYDISSDNSVPSKKYVKDEVAKINTKISTEKSRITRNLNSINTLKLNPKYSHLFSFYFSNPSPSTFEYPFVNPAGYASNIFFFSSDYNDKTELKLLGISLDNDSTVSGSTFSFSIEIKLFDSLGGTQYKTIYSNNTSIFTRINTNQFKAGADSKFKIKDHFPSNYNTFQSFQLGIKTPWTGNETILYFCINYY